MEVGAGMDAALVLRMLRVLLCRIVERRDRSAAHPRHRNTQARPNKVMARAFWSAFDQVFKENFSTKSPVFRAGAAPDGERLFLEGQARHMPLVRFSR